MQFSSFSLPRSTRSAPAASLPARTSRRERVGFRPQLEALEDRCLFSTLTVTNLNDSGAGSLRATITAAQSGDTIVFSSSLFSTTTALSSPLLSNSTKGNNGSGKGHGKPTSPPPPPSSTPNTITLTGGHLLIGKSLTIQGPSTSRLTISGNRTTGVLAVAQNTAVTISGITMSNGWNSGSGGNVINQGALTLNGCTVSNGSVLYYGGGIYNLGGTLTLNSTTVSGNSARFGGGIYNAGGLLTIDSSTISGNTAFHSDYPWSGGEGGGIFNDANGSVVLRNASSITGNTSTWYEAVGLDVDNLGTIYRDGTSTIGVLYGNAAIQI
jgi:hypothetical protein